MIAMADKVSIVIDAGHGGQDPGAVFQGREEKTDTLRLALAVGQILTENGMDVSYTRVTDRYHTPGEKAEMANYQMRIISCQFTEMPCRFREPHREFRLSYMKTEGRPS